MGRGRQVRITAIIETTQMTTAKKKYQVLKESSKYDEFHSIMRRTENVAAFFLDKASRLAKLACRKRSAPCYTSVFAVVCFYFLYNTCKRKPLAEYGRGRVVPGGVDKGHYFGRFVATMARDIRASVSWFQQTVGRSSPCRNRRRRNTLFHILRGVLLQAQNKKQNHREDAIVRRRPLPAEARTQPSCLLREKRGHSDLCSQYHKRVVFEHFEYFLSCFRLHYLVGF